MTKTFMWCVLFSMALSLPSQARKALRTVNIEITPQHDSSFCVGSHPAVAFNWDHARSLLTIGESAAPVAPVRYSISWKGLPAQATVRYTGEQQSLRLYDYMPARAEYFSWINNTNEGADEQQTLVNLNYFQWLKNTYGMQLDIYAFDAGAVDGSRWYGTMDSERFKTHFPHSFDVINEKANRMGTRMGLWGGPDGFGQTPATAEARKQMLADLCRKYGWALFKFDAVCGPLQPSHAADFADMLGRCRSYSPDLILLNHRLGLAEADSYATTQLWEGRESYTDVNSTNWQTAPHHRAGAMSRTLVPELRRTVEDHGVCLSSCLDGWDDELVLSAFGRNLVLAPQIYGNPWLLRDEEQARMARLFNIHRHYAPLMNTGLILPSRYGDFAVSRGNEQLRVIVLRNLEWTPRTVQLKLDDEMGLTKHGRVTLMEYHPNERKIGSFAYGSTVKVTVQPFRALLLVATTKTARLLPVKEHHSDVSVKACGEMTPTDVPADADCLYESLMFALDNNALEVRSLQRAGQTAVPQVQAARDAFFHQPTFVERGIWDDYLFDENPSTGFFPSSCQGDQRIAGGCLRVDLGSDIYVDSIRLYTPSYFGLRPMQPFEGQMAAISSDLNLWQEQMFLADTLTTLPVQRKMRYLKVYNAPQQLSEVEVYAGGKKLAATGFKANNLFAPSFHAVRAWTLQVKVPQVEGDAKLCVALEGQHGVEGAYAVARVGEHVVAAGDRAPSYPSNTFESNVERRDRNYTYYIKVTPEMENQLVDVFVLGNEACSADLKPTVYLYQKK
ncbi:hypothetical protein [Xylanibacter brevis]|uniref:hypothetical protein n=1 Tax=Xylanibacter brevis TaxID=83231 RepID=UPI0012DBF0B7|nr:hypothetical protein [Xylanibacter brevis]